MRLLEATQVFNDDALLGCDWRERGVRGACTLVRLVWSKQGCACAVRCLAVKLEVASLETQG
jgi:hypothetical protein